jgi:hypothetical protein
MVPQDPAEVPHGDGKTPGYLTDGKERSFPLKAIGFLTAYYIGRHGRSGNHGCIFQEFSSFHLKNFLNESLFLQYSNPIGSTVQIILFTPNYVQS